MFTIEEKELIKLFKEEHDTNSDLILSLEKIYDFIEEDEMKEMVRGVINKLYREI